MDEEKKQNRCKLIRSLHNSIRSHRLWFTLSHMGQLFFNQVYILKGLEVYHNILNI